MTAGLPRSRPILTMLPVLLRSFDVNVRRINPHGINNWLGHIPFAFDLVASLQPRLVVELGTHYGESYFGICQAVEERDLDCVCFAIDTWRGDEHAGLYGDEVLADVMAYNERTYARFSTLLRMSFDEALPRFADESICLLHIDGLHTWEAIRHDFEAWYPKVRPGGVILLHDIALRRDDFGVWRLWDELSARLPSFAFHHANGLGVIRKPGDRADPLTSELTALDEPGRSRAQKYYDACAQRVLLEFGPDRVRPAGTIRLFWPTERGYVETASARAVLKSGDWQSVHLEIPEADASGVLRLDPLDRPGLIEIADLSVTRAGRRIWRLKPEDYDRLEVQGTAIGAIADDVLIVLSLGNAPRLLLPETVPGQTLGDGNRAALEAVVRVRTDFPGAAETIRSWLLAQSGDVIEHRAEVLAAFERELQEIRGSLSWRLTAPLRTLGTKLGYRGAPVRK